MIHRQQNAGTLYLSSGDIAARRGSVPSLDGLRAVSISIVLLAHFVNPKLFPGGLGVEVFFIISGFLITRLLLAEQRDTGTVSLRMFYVRRICRLYPVIIVFAGLVIGLDILLQRPYNFYEPASALGYFTNYLDVYLESRGSALQMPFGIFWSLSIEEHFYILFPMTFVLTKGNPTKLLWILLALCTACLLLRVAGAAAHPDSIETLTFYELSQYRMDSIGFGVILALLCQTAGGRNALLRLAHPAYPAAALAVIVACLLVRNPWFRETLRYTLLGLSIMVIVAAILFGERYHRTHWLLNLPVLRWVGRLSYSLYVWHEGVKSFLPLEGLPLWQQSAIDLTASFAIAAASYYLVERPFLSLRKQLQSNQQSQRYHPLAASS
jgi:peptidoglycan/LPS O-acetylase OafA/YrhL